jgi:hypothetical protein
MTKNKILSDHKHEGKKLIPPFIHMLGPFHEVSWVKVMLPEFIWISLIQNRYGTREGVKIITSMTRIARECSTSEKKRIFATISSFRDIKPTEYLCIQQKLATSGQLSNIQEALMPMIVFYPDCPMSFLYSTKPSFIDNNSHNLDQFKTVVKGLYDKYSRDTIMVQSTAIWLAFDSGVLKAFKGLALAKFPEIENYPHTELSKKVAASISASIHMLFAEPHYSVSSDWPKYFWNRGIEIDQCCFGEAS